MNITVIRRVRLKDGSWPRRTVKMPERRRDGWMEKLDQDLGAYGADVVALGEYQLRWFDGRIYYEPVGYSIEEALQKLEQKANNLLADRANAKAGRVAPAASAPAPDTRKQEAKPVAVKPAAPEPLMTERLERFLATRRNDDRITDPSTLAKYRSRVEEFQLVTKVNYVSEVTKEHLEDFLASLRSPKPKKKRVGGRGRGRSENGLGIHARRSYFSSITAFLKWADKRLKVVIAEIQPIKKPKRQPPKTYKMEEVIALIESLTERGDLGLALAAAVFVSTGVREQELSHLAWNKEQLDLDEGFLHIRTGLEFHVKKRNNKGRVVPAIIKFDTKTRVDRPLRIGLEPDVVERLKRWKDIQPVKSQFVFPNQAGNPDSKLLKRIKIAAYEAGLACGDCANCLKPCRECPHCRCKKCKACQQGNACQRPHEPAKGKKCLRIQCSKWILHRFRHTFATTALRSGKVDLIMLRDLLGHTDVASTQIYVGAAREDEAKKALSGIFTVMPRTGKNRGLSLVG